MDPKDFAAAIRLFDETTAALASQVRRLEEVLTSKQAELVATNGQLTEKVAELDRLTAWLNLVMGSVASGVVAIGLDGKVTTCNDAAATALAGSVDDLLDTDWKATFPGSPLLHVLTTGRAEPAYERRVRGPDGSRRVLRARATPLRSPQGTLLGAVEVFDDITDLLELQERAERADRLKQLGEMAAGVAHEIRNPLNGIEGFASLLLRDLPEDDRRRRYAQAITDGVRDLNRTVSELLEYTRPRRLDRRTVDPEALAREVVELINAETVGDETAPICTVELASSWPSGTVTLDPAQVRQVLINLVQNAVHAVTELDPPRPGRVVVGVAPMTVPGVELTVDDNGPGVPEADRSRIFTPFFTTRDQGTGLGLAIAHTIVGLHGGSITVEEAPLGGARFRLTLPATA